MKYDRQTKALYDWENTWGSFCRAEWTTLHAPRKNIRKACRLYRVPVPTVVWLPKPTGYPDYNPVIHQIRVSNDRYNNAPTALHEAAHAIHDWLFGADGEPHSPVFVGIYLHLMIKWRVAPATALVASLIEAGVRFISLKDAAPAGLYRVYKRDIERVARQRRLGL